MMNTEQITMLVSFFNMRAGTRCWASSEKNQKAANAAYDSCGEDMSKLSVCMSAEEIIETCLVKGLDKDSLNMIGDKVSGCGKWSAGFIKVQGGWK